MESCFETLKQELEVTEHNGRQEARSEIAHYIRYDNVVRKHSGVEYLKPAQFEAHINQREKETEPSAKTSPPHGVDSVSSVRSTGRDVSCDLWRSCR